MTDPTPYPEPDYAPVTDWTGTKAHDALRRHWGVPPGGNNPTRRTTPQRTRPGGDITANLQRAYKERSRRIYDENHAKAVAAHADYVAGMSYADLQAKWGLSDTTLRLHWRNEGLDYETRPRKVALRGAGRAIDSLHDKD